MGRGSRGIRSYEKEMLAIEVIPPHDRLDHKSNQQGIGRNDDCQ
jgi:hypothetical protein